MQVTLFDHTQDPEVKIATCAAECHDGATEGAAMDRRITHLMKVRHLSTLRFAYATFKVEGISRVCSHQLVRHAHLSYLQRSQRYCNEAESDFVYPPGLDDAGKAIFDMGIAHTRTIYSLLIERGLKKGDARFILTNATETSMYVTGNFHAWFDMLSNRLDKAAQWEIRLAAKAIWEQLMVIAPNVFGELENLALGIDPGATI
jgi:thymidylate synthase (FAD)